MFKVDTSGVVTVNGTLDRENQDRYTVLVAVSDDAAETPGLTTTVTLSITVNGKCSEISLSLILNMFHTNFKDFIAQGLISTVVLQVTELRIFLAF